MVEVQAVQHALSPYHYGEEMVQERAGVRESSERVGNYIRTYINDQHKGFFEDLSVLHVGVRNPDGDIWATTLCGMPGFMRAADDKHMDIELKQTYADPARFSEGLPIGSIGMMLHNRRRNKLNGVVESLAPGHMLLQIQQAIGNCPKYIQVRHVSLRPEVLATLGEETRKVDTGTTTLGPEETAFVRRSDTMFLATGFVDGRVGQSLPKSCDCNHRGGAPGFVKVLDDGSLLLPDYIGNNMFQSLGNIVAHPFAGIQFLDFESGDSLQLTGKAELLHETFELPGAQRTIKFSPTKWVHVRGALPIQTDGSVEPSPYNPVPDGASIAGLKCVGKRNETHDIVTFEFPAPVSASDKPFCEAGQFASFDFSFAGGKKSNRTWTISSTPEEVSQRGRFQISVKKAGLVSSWLHDELQIGQEVQFRGVDGEFTLDKAVSCIPPEGILLIAGGIGVTPMRVMFAEAIRRGYPVDFIYTFRTEKDAAFLQEFHEAAKSRENVHLAVVLTGEKAGFELPGIATFNGRLNAGMIKQVSPNCLSRETFLCGPGPMMASATKALESLGVSTKKIHQESFSF